MKLTITADQAAKLAARESDLDPTTGTPDYIPGFVPSAADRYYQRRIERLRAISLETYLARQIAWSRETFGPAMRTKGITDHIRKELVEVELAPLDLSEWADIVMIAMDGFWRHGGQAEALIPALSAKLEKNRERVWPDWRTMSEDVAIEHDRSCDRAVNVIEVQEAALTAVADWINSLPIPTTGATRMLGVVLAALTSSSGGGRG